MNEYSAHMIRSFYKKYTNRSFDQDDVALFIISSRDYANRGKPIREIGDFIAHPAARDKGPTHSSVKDIAPKFEEMLRKQYTHGEDEPDLPYYLGIGSQEDFLADLIFVFKLADTGGINESTDSLEFRDFLFCIIFLLCKFTVKIGAQNITLEVSYSRDLELTAIYESTVYAHHRARLTIIRIRGVWPELGHFGHHTPLMIRNHIARRFVSGILYAIPYSDDLSINSFTDLDFKSGEMFPLPNLLK